MGLTKLTVESLDHQLAVKANAYVYDSRPGMYYLWSLRVLSPNGEVLVPRHVYRNQPIRTGPGKDLYPELVEMLPLGPGNYRVEVAMHAMHMNRAFEEQQFEGNVFDNTCNQIFTVLKTS